MSYNPNTISLRGAQLILSNTITLNVSGNDLRIVNTNTGQSVNILSLQSFVQNIAAVDVNLSVQSLWNTMTSTVLSVNAINGTVNYLNNTAVPVLQNNNTNLLASMSALQYNTTQMSAFQWSGISTLSLSTTQISTRIDSLSTNVSNNNASMMSLSGYVSSVNASLMSLSNSVQNTSSSHWGAINVLQTSTTEISGRLATLSTTVSNINASLM